MKNQNESSSWASRDVTLPLVLSGVVSMLCFIGICVVAFLSQDFINNSLAPKLGWGEPTSTLPPTQAPISCPYIPKEWRLVMNNDFDTNMRMWPLGKTTNAYADTDLQMVDGLLRFNIKSHQGVYYLQTPGMNNSVQDFFVKTQARKVSGPQNTNYGLSFTASQGQLFFFAIQDSGIVSVLARDADGRWQAPLFQGYSDKINPGESNKLAILADDGHYTFCINQYTVTEIDSADYPLGTFGLGVNLQNGNDEATFEFDDFIIYMK